MLNCIFKDNLTTGQGGAIWDHTGGTVATTGITNCTFACNKAENPTGSGTGGGLYINTGTKTTVTNCTFWDNSDNSQSIEDAQIKRSGTIEINHSCVKGWTGGLGGTGNIGSEPLLDDDLRPRSQITAVCINTGSNTPPSGPLPALDLAGRPRIQENVVDMGVFERSSTHVTGAISRKTHGSAGTFDVDLTDPLSGGINVAVECRQGGPTQVIVTFNDNIQGVGDLDPTDIRLTSNGATNGTVNNVTIDGNALTIDINGVTDTSRLQISFPGIRNTGGTQVCDTVYLGVLLGDATGDGKVNVLDLLAIKPQVNQPVTTSNFRCDVNADGSINVLDLLATKNNLNHAIPATCPGGCLAEGGQGEGFAGGNNKSGQFDQLSLKISGTEFVNGNISVALHPHGTDATEIKLPPEGGTVLVDLVLTSDVPVRAFSGRINIDPSGTASIASGDWTARANLLFSYGLADSKPTAWYDLKLFDWLLLTKEGETRTDDASLAVTCDECQVVTMTSDLSALKAGVDEKSGTLWGLARASVPAGTTAVLTLPVELPGVSGNYRLTLEDGVFLGTSGERLVFTAGKPLVISVGMK